MTLLSAPRRAGGARSPGCAGLMAWAAAVTASTLTALAACASLAAVTVAQSDGSCHGGELWRQLGVAAGGTRSRGRKLRAYVPPPPQFMATAASTPRGVFLMSGTDCGSIGWTTSPADLLAMTNECMDDFTWHLYYLEPTAKAGVEDEHLWRMFIESGNHPVPWYEVPRVGQSMVGAPSGVNGDWEIIILFGLAPSSNKNNDAHTTWAFRDDVFRVQVESLNDNGSELQGHVYQVDEPSGSDASDWPEARMYAAATWHQGAVWMCGGGDEVEPFNDVWELQLDPSRETEGTWRETTRSAPWSARFGHALASAESLGLLVLAGGRDADGRGRDDVWLMDDDEVWIQRTAAAPWGSRSHATMIEFSDRLWLVGGMDSSGHPKADVWSTEGGANWVLASDGMWCAGAPEAPAIAAAPWVVSSSAWATDDDVSDSWRGGIVVAFGRFADDGGDGTQVSDQTWASSPDIACVHQGVVCSGVGMCDIDSAGNTGDQPQPCSCPAEHPYWTCTDSHNPVFPVDGGGCAAADAAGSSTGDSSSSGASGGTTQSDSDYCTGCWGETHGECQAQNGVCYTAVWGGRWCPLGTTACPDPNGGGGNGDSSPVVCENCVVGAWTEWSLCSNTCGGGTRSRTRAVTTEPVGDGDPCPETTDNVLCNTLPCEHSSGSRGVTSGSGGGSSSADGDGSTNGSGDEGSSGGSASSSGGASGGSGNDASGNDGGSNSGSGAGGDSTGAGQEDTAAVPLPPIDNDGNGGVVAAVVVVLVVAAAVGGAYLKLVYLPAQDAAKQAGVVSDAADGNPGGGAAGGGESGTGIAGAVARVKRAVSIAATNRRKSKLQHDEAAYSTTFMPEEIARTRITTGDGGASTSAAGAGGGSAGGGPSNSSAGAASSAPPRADSLLPSLRAEAFSIPFEQLTLEEKVGAGGAGQVWRGSYGGARVAMKQLFSSMIDATDVAEVRIEASLLSQLRHPHVVQFYGVSINGADIYIVTEFCESSLQEWLADKTTDFSLRRVLELADETAQGMAYLHSRGVIHRDLKPENLLLTTRGKEGHIRIIDLGLARVAMAGQSLTVNKGTPHYMAPEMFNEAGDLEGGGGGGGAAAGGGTATRGAGAGGAAEGNYTAAVDVYAFGVCLWSMYTRKQPYAAVKNVFSLPARVTKGLRPPVPADCPPMLADLMQRCWHEDPKLRPEFKTCIRILRDKELLATAEKELSRPVPPLRSRTHTPGSGVTSVKNPLA